MFYTNLVFVFFLMMALTGPADVGMMMMHDA
jgi:hypothetical protein